jgi:hypothetical protein
MMTSSEFVKKLRVGKSRQAFVVMGIIVASSAIMVPILTPSRDQLGVSMKVFGIMVIGWISLAVFAGQKISEYLLRRQGLVCPSCQHLLETIRTVETRRCPHCGTEVIRDT